MISFSVKSVIFTDKIIKKVEKTGGQRLLLVGNAVKRVAQQELSIGGGAFHVPSNAPEPPHLQSGDLRNSINVEQIGVLTVIIGPSVFYGKYHEFGSTRTPERPFMVPALEQVEKVMPQFFRKLW